MRAVRNANVILEAPKGPNNRRCGRVRCDGLRCIFLDEDNEPAEVLDFSASGMRLRLRHSLGLRTGDSPRVRIQSAAGGMEMYAGVVWATRKGFRRHELGLTFGVLSENFRLALSKIMRAAADNYVVYAAS